MSHRSLSALAHRFGLLAFLSYALFGYGYAPPRIMAAGASLLALSGLIWGAWTGYALQHDPPSPRWIKLLKLTSLAIVLTIGIGIARGQIELAPDFQRYAQEWDARHQEIIARRDRGQTIIDVAPLTYDLAEYMQLKLLTLADSAANHCARCYYGVESIALRETDDGQSAYQSSRSQPVNPPQCPPK